MITEDYVSYEVAKLLKEKGFDEICTLAYEELNQLKVMMNWRVASGYLPCPTHQMAMKWLREKGILVLPDVRIADGKWFCMIVRRFEEVDNGCTGERRAMGYYNAYEEAVEVALKYSLENLI